MDHDDPYREVDDLDRTDKAADDVDSSHIERDGVLADNDVEDLPDDLPEDLPLREAARDLVKSTPEGRALKEKLDAFDKLDDTAKEKAAPEIREDIADIVARAVTEQHQRAESLNALSNFRNDQILAASEPADRQQQHPLAAQLLDVVEDILTELGKEMLIEALLPGAHVLLPPTDFVDSVFTAVELFEIAENQAVAEVEAVEAVVVVAALEAAAEVETLEEAEEVTKIEEVTEIEDHPIRFEIEDDPFWPP